MDCHFGGKCRVNHAYSVEGSELKPELIVVVLDAEFEFGQNLLEKQVGVVPRVVSHVVSVRTVRKEILVSS